MRGFKMRLLSCGLLGALVAWAVTLGGHSAHGQPGAIAQPGKPGQPAKDDKKAKDDRSELDEQLPIAFPYERDAKRRLEAVRDYLGIKDTSNIKWNEVCSFLQQILDSKSDSFFDVKYKVNGETRVNRISVKTEANRIISTFPKEGLQFYQQLQGANAAALLDDAIKANYDLAVLADLSQRYFHTKAGAEGTILLATIFLERGNYLEAAYAFERLFPRKDQDDVKELFTARTLFKMCVALKRSGDPRHAELYKKALAQLDQAAKNGVTISGRTYPLDKIRAELDRPVELIRASALVGEWSMRGGNPARSAVVDGGPPFLDAVFKAPMFYHGDDKANLWIKGELEKLFNRDPKMYARGVPLPAAFPVSTSDVLIFRSYDAVTAVSTRDRLIAGRTFRAGEMVWRSKTTGGLHQLIGAEGTDDFEMERDVQAWWSRYATPQANVSSLLYENPLNGSLAHDGQFVYFVDDVAIPPPPVYSNPDFGINGGPQYRQNGDLADMIRAGRLAAVDMRTGLLKWDLGRVKPPDNNANLPPLPGRLSEEEADKTTDAFRLCLDAVFLGAPMPLNGRLYVLIEQAGCIRLLCLDPKNLVQPPGQTRKPALLWSQKLGKPNNALPQDSVRRYQGATLAAGEGILVCPTNCGGVVAVDIMSRSLLWAHGYRFLEANTVRNPRQPQFGPDGQPIFPQQLPNDRWRASGPIISGGRVLVSAYDSNRLECLDIRTGRVLWYVLRDSSDLFVGGVVNDRVLVVGKNQIKAFHLTGEDKDTQKPKLAWGPVVIPTPTGHGAIGRNAYYLPVRQELAGVNTTPAGEIWAINIENGQIVSKTGARKRNDTAELARYGIGNLVFQDGMVFAQSPWELACYPQLELKIAEMNKLLAANPKDPIGLMARGELRLDDGKLKEAVEDFKEAEKNDLPPEKRPLLREKLYIAYTELLRADFNAAEAFLPEYAALCEVPPEPGELAEDKVRRDDETRRRKRDYLYLLARGRETQGKLAEAFDHYLALAALTDGKQPLIDIPDEPNVKMRPDVWARGRIESMIGRAATPTARKNLEQRINKEWDAVKDGTDLKKLREFVAVFGPFFDSGREAQFKLADVLLGTNNEPDAREAQTHLAQLRVTAADPAVRARATETLAQLMIKNRMMEDAVGLYAQLGKEYPDLVIRDGKTGADFLTDLLTDKRLLPFLEPSRYPLPTRVRAEQKDAQNNINYGAQFEIESPADLFPMFRQYRFVLDQFRSGNGSWSLIGYDRATGNERCRFPNMMAPNLYSTTNQPIPYSRFVQGNGHVMLVQLGTWVYCFDLAEKKELWNRNLLGDTPPQLAPGNPNPPVEIGPDGECTIRYPDGYTITLGRSTIVQPGFVALLTRDGLECVDPQTRRLQWVRKGIPDRTQIHGDARYIVMIETDVQRKPVATKLIRAVDGMVVENSPDSGRVLAEARSFKLIGRHALLAAGTGEEPRTLRLYDLATGKDVWKKMFDPKAIPITCPIGNDWTGFIKPDGTAEVLSVKTGEPVATLKIDPKNVEAQLKPCSGAQLLADADRFYLILDRDPTAGSTNGTRPVQIFNNYMLRSQKVNGPIYAFDRATGKRLWTYSDVLENQWLVLEQFGDLPVLIASAPMMRENNQYVHAVVVIEKERGRLVFDKNVQYNGNFFQTLTVDQKNGTIGMNRIDTRIFIQPEEPRAGR